MQDYSKKINQVRLVLTLFYDLICPQATQEGLPFEPIHLLSPQPQAINHLLERLDASHATPVGCSADGSQLVHVSIATSMDFLYVDTLLTQSFHKRGLKSLLEKRLITPKGLNKTSMENRGFEPLTSAVRSQRSTN